MEYKLIDLDSSIIGEPVDFGFLRPLKPSVVFGTYWRLAAERQRIFSLRMKGVSPPWSSDPILLAHKFTNAYRASDRVSQYLIKKVIYCDEFSIEDTFFRIILFKIFNRIDTWEMLENEFGTIRYETFSNKGFDAVLTRAMDAKEKIYSAAYIMPSGGRSGFGKKHRMHLHLIQRMMDDGLPLKISKAKSMATSFELLRSYPTIGDFLAYQYATDLNYSGITDFTEMEFVVPGPGALSGIKKCFFDTGGLNEVELIRFVAERQDECISACGTIFESLWGRKLQLIDCQNLFCEVDKYSRIAHPEFEGTTKRTRIKQKFYPSNLPFAPWYPPKWGINKLIAETFKDV